MYEKLREKRKEKNVQVKNLCEILSLQTEAAYFKKETGAVKITVEEAILLARFFRTSVERLFR
jgi:hypothetical protein